MALGKSALNRSVSELLGPAPDDWLLEVGFGPIRDPPRLALARAGAEEPRVGGDEEGILGIDPEAHGRGSGRVGAPKAGPQIAAPWASA
jgi:hypothetical protein